ncbi:MAG: RNA polymerase sigma factor [Armatimonadota bacterium]
MDGAISVVSERSFEELVCSQKQRVFGYLRRVTGETAASEELALEVFTRASRLRAARPGLRPELWLLRLATDAVLSRSLRPSPFWPWRGRRRAPAHFCPAPEPPAAGLPEQVEQALRTLPVELRIALVLHDVERLSAAEAAEAAGCTPEEIRRRVSEARARLRPVLYSGVSGGV